MVKLAAERAEEDRYKECVRALCKLGVDAKAEAPCPAVGDFYSEQDDAEEYMSAWDFASHHQMYVMASLMAKYLVSEEGERER